MAWSCSGSTNKALVENLWACGLIEDQRVKDAFLQVDRAHYAPSFPYSDSPQSIGHAATISAPHMHASAAESLRTYVIPSDGNPAPRVLDIGSGSGYLTHVLAELVGPSGMVVGLEHIAELTNLGEKNMAKSEGGQAFLSSGRVKFVTGDGRKGWPSGEEKNDEQDRPEKIEWDAIHVGAAASIVHQELLDQLKAPGRMFIPVADTGGFSQHIWVIDKQEDGSIVRNKTHGVSYVPLTDAPNKRT